jgi:hypothetical protein
MRSRTPDESELSLSQLVENETEEHPLARIMKALRSSKAARLFKEDKIGSFWAENEARSPFEEEITIGQLCGVSVEVLLQKRSFTEKKQKALIRAIERSMEIAEKENSSDYQKTVSSVAHHYQEDLSHKESSSITSPEMRLSNVHPLASATLLSFLNLATRDSSPLRRVAKLFSQALEVRCIEIFLLTRYLSESQVAGLLNISVENIHDSLIKVQTKGKALCAKDPLISFPSRLMNEMVAVCPDYLIAIIQEGEAFDRGAADLSFSLLCNSAGLLSFQSDVSGFSGLLTSKEERLTQIMVAFIESLPQPTHLIINWLESTFPLVTHARRQAMLASLQCNKKEVPQSTIKEKKRKREKVRKISRATSFSTTKLPY